MTSRPNKLRLYIEHCTNPTTVWCRMLSLLEIYDRIWSRLHKRKPPPLTPSELVAIYRLKAKIKRIRNRND